jgi:hypothetical protein
MAVGLTAAILAIAHCTAAAQIADGQPPFQTEVDRPTGAYALVKLEIGHLADLHGDP